MLIRHLWELGLPDGVHCPDGGTGGMDVAFQMPGVRHVILVDACVSGSEPGAIFKLPAAAVETLPPLAGINLHAFRWDHALSFAHWLLKDDYPPQISVYLIEAQSLVIGEALSDPVAASMRRLALLLLDGLRHRGDTQTPMTPERGSSMPVEVEFTPAGYLRLSREIASRYFPSDGLVAMVRGPEMWLMPTHGSASGGSLLKQRNPQGDRAVLVREELHARSVSGHRLAFWDATQGALRVALEVHGAQ